LRKFWSFKPQTPEEIETIEDCRSFTRKNILLYSALGIGMTSVTSYYYRRDFPRYLKIMGLVIGVVGGGIFGILKSTEYTLKRFEKLGPDYDLGRLAIGEIEEFRMDKKRKSLN